MLLRHYANAKLITDSVLWLSGNKLPAFSYGSPNLYMQCKEDDYVQLNDIHPFQFRGIVLKK